MAKKKKGYGGVLEIEQSIDFEAVASKITGQLRYNVQQKGLENVGRIVIDEAQKRVPKSSQTGTKKKWSRSYRERYRKSTPLHTQFITKPLSYRGGTVIGMVVKVRYPQGAHGHLVEFGHRSVLWGRRTGNMVQGKRFMLPAIEASKTRADNAFRLGVETAIVMAGG
jgi:hypothetical protein